MNARQVHHLHSQPPSEEEVLSWIGSRATDANGRPVGKVEDAYRVGEKLEWLLIRHRRSHHLLAPVRTAVASPGKVFLPYSLDQLESAPQVKPGEKATSDQIAEATRHYGLGRRTGS